MQGGTLLGDCTSVADGTIWVIWIWAEIWVLWCDMTLCVPFYLQCFVCDISHVSVSFSPPEDMANASKLV